MPDGVIFIAAVVGLLGVVILVHEWGHFIAAKSFGVRVDVFSIGFGKRIWGWRRGVTDYRLSILPLGGYVKMAGDNPMEERAGAPDEFLSKPRWQRAVIAVAGPGMNVVLAIALFTGLNYFGTQQPVYMSEPAVVADVQAGSEASLAGIKPGDRIVEINGVPNPTWEHAVQEMLLTVPGRRITLKIERDGRIIDTSTRVPTDPTRSSPLGSPAEEVLVGQVTRGAAAEKAGLLPGDQIVSVNEQEIHSRSQFIDRIQEAGGAPVKLRVKRSGEGRTLRLEPYFGNPDGRGERWLIGMNFQDNVITKMYPLGESFVRAGWFSVRVTRQIVGVIVELFRGAVSIKTLGGPLEIMMASGEAAQRGLPEFVYLMAIISLNLAILNLLPIPILDGGHLLMLSIEGLMRRDLSLAVKERFVQVGFVFLMLIFVVVMYNDILKRIPKSWW
jgi:regulator of sigma E protease